MIQKEGLIEDIAAVAQCLLDRAKEHDLKASPLKRLCNIWGGITVEDLGDDSYWLVQLEHEELDPGTFRFLCVSSKTLEIYEGEDFNALQALNVNKNEVTFIYEF